MKYKKFLIEAKYLFLKTLPKSGWLYTYRYIYSMLTQNYTLRFIENIQSNLIKNNNGIISLCKFN